MILNRPNCAKCQHPAITVIGKSWVCGDCLTKFLKKKAQVDDDLLFTV